MQVLQKNTDKDKELHLFSDTKEHAKSVAQLRMVSLSSQPVDHVENGQRKTLSSDVEVGKSMTVMIYQFFQGLTLAVVW